MTSDSPLAIEATGLVKSFGDTVAVDGVDLAVRTGSVYGVLGPNGAGKTTTIRMLATLLRPDAGSARVLGHDIVKESDAVRGLMSLTGQLASVDEDLTGRENLILLGRLLGLRRAAAKERASELLDAFGLSEAAGRLVKNYSGGMRRRLDIAASIVVTPQLMFLDEPTTGLDPRSRNQVWDIIRALVAEGTTILLCTQYLDEADQLAEGIAVIDRGKVIAEGTPGQLKASVGSGALHVRLLDPAQRHQAEQLLGRQLGTVSLEPDPAALSVPCADADRAAEAVAELARSGVRVADFSLGQPSLDEVFMALTGHPADDAEEETDTSRRSSRHERHSSHASGAQHVCLRRGRAPQGALLHAAPAARERTVGGAHLRLARDAQGEARARAAPRRDHHARDVRAPVHLHLRRGHLRLDGRVPGLHPPGPPRDVGPVHHGLLRGRAEHRPDEGRRGSLPLAADLAAGAATRSPPRRLRALPRRGNGDHPARAAAGLPTRGRGWAACSRRWGW